MGKSDSFIFDEYEKILSGVQASSVAFLGFSKENEFTRKIRAPVRDFYDLSLDNWNIKEDWQLRCKYDLIACTRCAYFSDEPAVFVNKCKEHLTKDGHALIDWGLGDHWRFSDYKVGWVRNGEHEHAYGQNNLLSSCYWRDDLVDNENVKAFWDAVRQDPARGYSDKSSLTDVVREEVPKLVDYPVKKLAIKFLWPDSPQLYIITLVDNNTTH
jgi:SAM-dependent methyltransferase